MLTTNHQIDRSDDSQWIDREWVQEFAVKEPHCWKLPGTDYHLYENVSGPLRSLWTVFEVMDDGDEKDVCHVMTRGDLVRTLEFLEAFEKASAARCHH